MASNLNKAFMRAYAKDRNAAPAEPTSPATAPQSQPNAYNVSVQADSNPPQGQPSFTRYQINGLEIYESASPSASPLAARYVTNSGSPAMVGQPAPIKNPTNPTHGATDVWQRIDQAQVGHAAPHYMNAPQQRPHAMAEVSSSGRPRSMHAAAVESMPTQRTPMTGSPMVFQHPLLKSDVDNAMQAAPAQPESAETKRKTVADFLYAAGNAGPSIKTAPTVSNAVPGPSYPSERSAPIMNSAGVNSQSFSAPSMAPTGNFAVHGTSDPRESAMRSPAYGNTNQPVATAMGTSSGYVVPGHTSTDGLDEPAEHMPRRMGQILRVDVPRNASDAAAIRADEVKQSSAAQSSQTITSARYAVEENMERPAKERVESAAKYIIEQRRMDLAHEASAAEEKLRQAKHKIFNPVWEVDNLQWPAVCDRLMEHRAESMAQVAAHLKSACQDGLCVLGVTSPGNGEGRTTVACCLARLAASHGMNVALIDLDLDHPTLCLQTNMEVEHDWRDCLNGEVKLEDVAVHSIDDQLTVFPLKPRGGRPGLLASDSRIADILSELSSSFELVVVDASKMNSSGNVVSGLADMQIFDAAIIVVDRRNSNVQRVEETVEAVQMTGIESVGIVDNFSM